MKTRHLLRRKTCVSPFSQHELPTDSVSGLVVKSIVAIDGPRVRFAADARNGGRGVGFAFGPAETGL